ncbi:MAG: hypothetical protein AB1641_05540 [Thermodesulfobacteriota bacterium]
MKKLIGVSLVLGVILVLAAQALAAQLKEEELEVLRDLPGVRVEVERLKPEIERDGLYCGTLQTDVELKLQMVGIKVLSEEEWLKTTGSPYLYLHIDVLKYSKGYVYRIHLALREKVNMTRKHLQVFATTMRMPVRFGVTKRLANIREETDDIIDIFINNWMEANAK